VPFVYLSDAQRPLQRKAVGRAAHFRCWGHDVNIGYCRQSIFKRLYSFGMDPVIVRNQYSRFFVGHRDAKLKGEKAKHNFTFPPFSLITFVYLFCGVEGRDCVEFIGRCCLKRLRFRLRAFTDFNFAFCPGGMK
jgi:hypothetical protein